MDDDTVKQIEITLDIDEDVLDWLQKNSSGDYKAYINNLLRNHVERQQIQKYKLDDIEAIRELLMTRGLN